MQLVVHPAAGRELDEALTWCATRFGERVSARLLLQFDKAGEMLMAHPQLGSPTPTSVRQMPLHRFPYSLVYRIDGPVIHVLALMHQRRKPGYWAGRE